MVLTIIGHAGSSNTRRVLLILNEKGVEYTLKSLDWANGENKSEAYLDKQPFGQVPVLVEDDGFTLYESRAITRYIAIKYADQGTKLLPSPADAKATALFEQAACVEQSDFDPYANGLARQKIWNALQGIPEDQVRVKYFIETLDTKLDSYERILAKQKYMAGDELTLVDLWHLPYGEVLEKHAPHVFERHPKVNAWFQALKQREAWVKAKEA